MEPLPLPPSHPPPPDAKMLSLPASQQRWDRPLERCRPPSPLPQWPASEIKQRSFPPTWPVYWLLSSWTHTLLSVTLSPPTPPIRLSPLPSSPPPPPVLSFSTSILVTTVILTTGAALPKSRTASFLLCPVNAFSQFTLVSFRGPAWNCTLLMSPHLSGHSCPVFSVSSSSTPWFLGGGGLWLSWIFIAACRLP